MEIGPFAMEQVKAWVVERRYNIFTPARREGEAKWKMIGSYVELSTTRATPFSPPTRTAIQEQPPAAVEQPVDFPPVEEQLGESLPETVPVVETSETVSEAEPAQPGEIPSPPPLPPVETAPPEVALTEPLKDTMPKRHTVMPIGLRHSATIGTETTSAKAIEKKMSPPSLPNTMIEEINAEGKFVKKRVGHIRVYGQYRGSGSINIKDEQITFEGRHVRSMGARLALGLFLYLAAVGLTMGYFAPGIILVYLLVEYVWLKKETITVPLVLINRVSTDPIHYLVAIQFSGHHAARSVVLQCEQWREVAHCLYTANPALNISDETKSLRPRYEIPTGIWITWIGVIIAIAGYTYLAHPAKKELIEVASSIGVTVAIAAAVSVVLSFLVWFVSRRSWLAAAVALFVSPAGYLLTLLL